MATTRTNDQWASAIQAKINELASTTDPDDILNALETPFSRVISPQDPKLPLAIDHTLLKPDATAHQIDELCEQAIKYGFKSCCVNGANVKRVTQKLAGSSVVPCAVIGFPLGASTSIVKAFEASQAIADGATEVDMVINIGSLKSKDYASVYDDIKAVTGAAASTSTLVKVILETVFLTDEEIVSASLIAAEADADFVKTSTGFLGGGATEEHVRLMKRTVAYKAKVVGEGGKGKEVRVKASGGVRTFESCVRMFRAGAERIGTSSGIAIMESTISSATY